LSCRFINSDSTISFFALLSARDNSSSFLLFIVFSKSSFARLARHSGSIDCQENVSLETFNLVGCVCNVCGIFVSGFTCFSATISFSVGFTGGSISAFHFTDGIGNPVDNKAVVQASFSFVSEFAKNPLITDGKFCTTASFTIFFASAIAFADLGIGIGIFVFHRNFCVGLDFHLYNAKAHCTPV